MPVSAEWRRASAVLCVRLDALGDVLMTSPALRAVKESAPGRRVVLLTSPAGARAAALLPEVDDVIAFEAPWMKASRAGSDAAATEQLVDRLRRARFAAAVIFTVYTQSPLPMALICHLAGIPLRLAHCRENPYQLLSDWVRDPEPQQRVRHEVRRQLDLVATVGCTTGDDRMRLRLPADAGRLAATRLAASGVDPARPWIAIHAGASAPSRRYPPEHFAEATARLAADGLQILFVGTADERASTDGIRAAIGRPSCSLVGATDTAELAAVLAAAPLVVANNSGPAHLAAAVGTPVVALYALTNPQHTPWRVASRVLVHDVPCRDCHRSVCPEGHHACLRGIDPARVVAAVHELLDGRATGDPRPAEEAAAHV